jgi:hypothetical protein
MPAAATAAARADITALDSPGFDASATTCAGVTTEDIGSPQNDGLALAGEDAVA